MPEENINQEFRLKKTDEIRNYLIEEINQNQLMMCFHFCFCFFSCYSNRNHEFSN